LERLSALIHKALNHDLTPEARQRLMVMLSEIDLLLDEPKVRQAG
jgi:hypothetical protein